jgi:2-polyprenyl-3-methyl-5-hydroxy-6-metoxy-1,4-benzoquinol methylase
VTDVVHGGVLVTSDAEASKAEAREIWDRKAAFWDDHMREGNWHSKELVWPAQERLLALRRGESVLEVGCGNGNFARRMAKAGAKVVASDFSEVFIDLARARTVEDADMIDYRVLDATDSGQLLALGEERFDAAVCTMALFDMAAIEPLATSLSRLLKPRGRFVFSIVHPCFESPTATKVTEWHDGVDGVTVVTHSIKVKDYATPFAAMGTGVLGEPEPHWYFHRPLSALLGTFFAAGFVLDGIEEPVSPHGEEGADGRRSRSSPPCWWPG